jgi:hypothetical protein
VGGRFFALRDELKKLVGAFEPSLYPGEDAAELVAVFAEIERFGHAGKLLCARRVKETDLHKQEGHKTAESWLANTTGEPVGQAIADLQNMERIENNPTVKDAFQSGKLSEAQANEIAAATQDSPGDAVDLVGLAEFGSFSDLRNECRKKRAATNSQEEEATRYNRIHQGRYLKLWTDQEGAGHLEAKMTPDAFGIVKSSLEQISKDIFEEARKEGRRESQRAYLLDALVKMAGGVGASGAGASDSGSSDSGSSDSGSESSTGGDSKNPRRRPLIRLRVDLPALLRGHRVGDEVCEIPGIDSPVPVATARALIGDAFLELFIAQGTDVKTVVTDTRHVARALRIALEERDSVCCVPGCNQSMGLQGDHWQRDFSKKGKTSLDNLAMLCPHHHDLKTHKGWRLVGPPGRWRFVGPEGEEPRANASGSDPPEQTHLL